MTELEEAMKVVAAALGGESPASTSVSDAMAENVAAIIKLDAQIEEAENKVAVLRESRAIVEDALKDQFVETETQSVKASGRLVFLYRALYCTVPKAGMPELVEVLDAHGVGDIAPRTAKTADIKELLKEDEATWKKRFGDLVSAGEKYQIRTKAAK